LPEQTYFIEVAAGSPASSSINVKGTLDVCPSGINKFGEVGVCHAGLIMDIAVHVLKTESQQEETPQIFSNNQSTEEMINTQDSCWENFLQTSD
jgi:hypothetical protein